jgi:hypothetical protein
MRQAIAAAILLAASVSVQAETGPCKPDDFNGLTCGEGAGAARAIEGTISPSRRLAFAWRSRSSAPRDLLTDRHHYDLESLVIRLADGVVLSKFPGEYWNTGAAYVNRYRLSAAWSPDSSFAVEILDYRWQTPGLRVYAFGADDKVLVLDLQSVIEPAARKYLAQAGEKESDLAFSIFGIYSEKPPRITIDNRGLIRAVVMMVTVRPETSYLMLEINCKIDARGGVLSAHDIKISDSNVEP